MELPMNVTLINAGAMRLAAVLFLAAAVLTPLRVVAGEVTVFAAASVKNAMDEIAQKYEAATGNHLVVSFAGSSALARQIEQGAPADIFISANARWMDALEGKGLIDPATRFGLLGNRLVLVAHGRDAAPVEIAKGLNLSVLLGEGRLSMALVDAVPAGIYGKSALTNLGLWEQVEAKVAQADNVRFALALVSAGEAPYGIVYATDAVSDDNVSGAGTFPADSHDPIVYPAAKVSESENPLAGAFLDYLRGDEARDAFENQGFTVLAVRPAG
jgi:molybdate transport system substrate-binding protein